MVYNGTPSHYVSEDCKISTNIVLQRDTLSFTLLLARRKAEKTTEIVIN